MKIYHFELEHGPYDCDNLFVIEDSEELAKETLKQEFIEDEQRTIKYWNAVLTNAGMNQEEIDKRIKNILGRPWQEKYDLLKLAYSYEIEKGYICNVMQSE